MEEYINKTALVAEIENKIKKYTKRGEESDAKRDGYGMYYRILFWRHAVRTAVGDSYCGDGHNYRQLCTVYGG